VSASLSLPDAEPKAAGSRDRSAGIDRTLALLPHLRRRFGITRVAETTRLDRMALPNFSAIVPDSPDLISAYMGKGTTREAALCSAVMEAVERQVAAAPQIPTTRRSVAELQASLDLDALGLLPNARDAVVECAGGVDLFTGDAVPVPLPLVCCPWFGPRTFASTSTNGLAAGNTPTEAIYHALCELIERHVWSLHAVRAQLVPRFYGGSGARDVSHAREIAFPTGVAELDAMYDRIAGAGLNVRALYLEASPLPPVMLACAVEERSDPPMAHLGLGCALAPSLALSRALTEVAQSRVGDISAIREDLLRADDPANAHGDRLRRSDELPNDRWYYDLPARPIALGDLADVSTDDLAADLRAVIASVRAAGARRLVAVDLSPPDVPISVVRLVAPDLESYAVDGRIGPGILNLFNPFRERKSP
jgi:ribosomal protein S12 methylthiotransferase accessory factor